MTSKMLLLSSKMAQFPNQQSGQETPWKTRVSIILIIRYFVTEKITKFQKGFPNS